MACSFPLRLFCALIWFGTVLPVTILGSHTENILPPYPFFLHPIHEYTCSSVGIQDGIYTIEYAGRGDCKGVPLMRLVVILHLRCPLIFSLKNSRQISLISEMGQRNSGNGKITVCGCKETGTVASRPEGAWQVYNRSL